MHHFNELTPAEAERLAVLAEECAEVIQAVGKILRHGYESCNPNDADETTNRELLTVEIGHVQAAREMMQDAKDVSALAILEAKKRKLEKIGRYLHHASAS